MSNWLQSYTGRKLTLLNLTEEDIDPRDILHSLPGINRYDCATEWFISVGQHTLNVLREAILLANLADANKAYPENIEGDRILRCVARKAMTHDGHEYITGDCKAPVKHLPFMEGFRIWEKTIEMMFECKFLKAYTEEERDIARGIVKEADWRVMRSEAREAMKTPPEPWEGPEIYAHDGFDGRPMSCDEVRGKLLSQWNIWFSDFRVNARYV